MRTRCYPLEQRYVAKTGRTCIILGIIRIEIFCRIILIKIIPIAVGGEEIY